MNKKILTFNLIMLLLAIPVLNMIAQPTPITKANYRLAERFSPEKMKKMVFSTTVNPNWLATGDRFWYSYKTSESTNYYLVDLDKKTKKPTSHN